MCGGIIVSAFTLTGSYLLLRECLAKRARSLHVFTVHFPKTRALMPKAGRDDQREVDGEDVEALLRRIADGDREARERLFKAYRPRLARIVRARLGKGNRRALADASDIVQKAMSVAVKRLDEYVAKRPMPVFLWLYVLARDQLRKAREKDARHGRQGLAEESACRIKGIVVDPGPSPSSQAVRDEMARKVREATKQLTPEHCEILIMRYDDGLKLTEIAAILGIGESAARMRHLRAIEEMKRLVGDGEPSG
jgi:RNA polymerase sigma-70 factor, ECF subfamily